jgi:hypothetical protein
MSGEGGLFDNLFSGGILFLLRRRVLDDTSWDHEEEPSSNREVELDQVGMVPRHARLPLRQLSFERKSRCYLLAADRRHWTMDQGQLCRE